MKKYKVTFTCVGDRTINLVLTEEQRDELSLTSSEGFFALQVGEKRKYFINMRNVVSVYIHEIEVDTE